MKVNSANESILIETCFNILCGMLFKISIYYIFYK